MVGLSLTGGGARGAYQAGVILGLAQILEGKAHPKDPFPWYAGISAGSINSTFCAASSRPTFKETAEALAEIWRNISPQQVYRTDAYSLGKIGLTWIRDTTFGSMFAVRGAKELLDARPLFDLLSKNIEFENIDRKIRRGEIVGCTCSCICYDDQKNVSFVQASSAVKTWTRTRRYARRTRIRPKHIMASCAIPVLFSPVKIGDCHYGDGTIRNTAPVSPIIHLGCRSFFLVGVRYTGSEQAQYSKATPSIARVAGTVINGSFFDLLDNDLERITQINRLLEHDNPVLGQGEIVRYLHIQPSQDISGLARETARTKLPRMVNYLLGGLGDENDSAELASYLLFVPDFTRRLVDLGYQDALARKDEILTFWAQSQEQQKIAT